MDRYKTYSWSEQARAFANYVYRQYQFALTIPERHDEIAYFLDNNNLYKIAYNKLGTHSEEYWLAIIQNSCRHPKITTRAAKRFGRLCRGESKI